MPPALRRELDRKAIHLSSALIPLCYQFLLPRGIVLTTVCVLLGISLAIEIARGSVPVFRSAFERYFGYMLRSRERRELSGATWVLAAAALSVALLPKPAAVTGLLFLSISDSLAALAGAFFGRRRMWGKSLAGSSAFFASALILARLMLDCGVPRAALIALLATAAEALPLRVGTFQINDNLAIPLISGVAIVLLQSV